ncbi:unnamed protein product [Camellia sinensis]
MVADEWGQNSWWKPSMNQRIEKKGSRVFSVGFNCNLNSPKFQSSIFGTVVPGKSSHLQVGFAIDEHLRVKKSAHRA